MKLVKHYVVIVSFDDEMEYDRCLYIIGNIHGYLSAYCRDDPTNENGYALIETSGEKVWKMEVDTISRRFRKFENVVTRLYKTVANLVFIENIG